MKVGCYSVAMDLVVQQKMVLLRDFIKRAGPLPEEYWSYIVAVVAAISARRLSMADLGQSNLAAEAGTGPWPKLRFLDLGSWRELKAEEAPSWPSRDSQLWTFMSGHLESAKVATLKSIAHGFKLIHEVRSSVRSVLSPAFQQAEFGFRPSVSLLVCCTQPDLDLHVGVVHPTKAKAAPVAVCFSLPSCFNVVVSLKENRLRIPWRGPPRGSCCSCFSLAVSCSPP